MAIGTLIKRLFATDTGSAAAVVQATFIKALESQDTEARLDAQRLIDWYNRDRAKIIEYLTLDAQKTFDSVADWQFPIINGVPRTIARRSTAYKTPPTREYYLNDKQLEPDSEAQKRIEAMYARLNINRKMRALDRWSTLLNTTHAEIVIRKGAIDWDIRLRPAVTVVEDPEDYLEFVKFAYQWNPIDPETLQPIQGWVYWSSDQHVFIGAGGKFVGMSNEAGTNPYKALDGASVIPIVTVRKIEDISDYWGRFGADLVDATQSMNLQLGNMWETMFLQIHGQPFGVNLGLKSGAKLLVGAKHPIVAEKVQKDEVAPSLSFPKPDPDLVETRDILDWFQKMNAGAYNLPPSAWSMDETRLSGFAKFMDNIELMETREEEIENWEAVEQDLFTKSAIVWNTWNAGVAVDLALEVRVTFPAVQIPETPTERTTRWSVAIKAGLASLVDYFREVEGLELDEAVKRAQEVAKWNEEIGGSPTEPALPPPPGTEEGAED